MRYGRMKKRFLSIALAAIMVVGLFPAGIAHAQGHTHTEDCYAKAGELLCTIPESTGHTHDENCYETQKQLTCELEENAEHTMLVDLARNDLNRHCTDVKVDFLKDTQFYSHVIHLVSRVSGKVRPKTNPIQLLADTFPAGTLSGAPKVRALQLISEYEPHNRGAYGGCIGFIGLNGTLNQAITIRSFVSRNGELWFQAGGGIVAASDEEYELQEVNNKLGALRRAITLAESKKEVNA